MKDFYNCLDGRFLYIFLIFYRKIQTYLILPLIFSKIFFLIICRITIFQTAGSSGTTDNPTVKWCYLFMRELLQIRTTVIWVFLVYFVISLKT
jgi:hypothetical protein